MSHDAQTHDAPARTRRSLADSDIALGPLDGRYRAAVAPLVDHLSEAALNRARLVVETEWMIHLLDREAIPGLRTLTDDERALLRAIPADLRDPTALKGAVADSGHSSATCGSRT